MKLVKGGKQSDRRTKFRFPIQREMRYKLLRETVIAESGAGQTVNIGSGGVAFALDRDIEHNAYVELSISWPVLLGDTCPMRLIVFGRVLRSGGGRSVCTIEKYEFRTQARVVQANVAGRNDSMLIRWAEALRKDSNIKARACAV